MQVEPKPNKRLTIQIDELWSFVDDKGNKQWVWLAIDAETREIVGCYIGDRSGDSAQKLWESLPSVYRQCAVIYTDFYSSYPVVLPTKRHRAVDKETGKNNYIGNRPRGVRSWCVSGSSNDLSQDKSVPKHLKKSLK
ncbi:MAG: IS1 family transposase [Pseudanabaena sp. M176S2SP2A07QC]|nr:IS1 family transposase [Pseudanabaena sp. M125S2SP2A07QC]MCA6536644.1 IS1 family transposase [Pseudanabaena sp. M176S2SP2A07QC]MCA6538847.1 IS1 family transposase [Pseudanabaena sp. M037S2SP2A07QC]MCA6567005.1 IS1 family transposase [Pseudanabaena sp. M151S2SP2A07QC]MCA6570054.1 IS1 family transposase [Pseudanabaena sp. M065S1SP2A07QC]